MRTIPVGRGGLLILLASIAFGASLAGSFHFDDYSIPADPAPWNPLTTRPLTQLTFWLNYRFGGADPIGYHAVNLALHLAAVLLAWRTLSRLLPEGAALIAAGLFAVHPIQTEAVNYVFARGTLLMTVFCLLALDDWLLSRHWRAVAWFAVALAAKEECAAFPVFLLLLNLSFGRDRGEWKHIGVMIGLALLAGIRVIMATAATPGAGSGFEAGISPAAYLLAQGFVLVRYLQLLAVPIGYTPDPDIRPAVWTSLACWAAVLFLAACCLARFKRGGAGFWLLAGLTLLMPSSTIFPAADLAADRRLYLPMIAFAGSAAPWLVERRRSAAVVLAILALLSLRQTLIWRTERSLWTEAARRAPEKLRPKIQLARALSPAEAIPVLEQARAIAPASPLVATEFGRVYLEAGQPQLALKEFGTALALSPNNALALNNRGVALEALGQAAAAREDYRRALARDPCLADARQNLRRLGEPAEPPPSCR